MSIRDSSASKNPTPPKSTKEIWPAAVLLTGVEKMFETADIYDLLVDFGKIYKISRYFGDKRYHKYVVFFENEQDAQVVKKEMENYQLGCTKLKLDIASASSKNKLNFTARTTWKLIEVSRKEYD